MGHRLTVGQEILVLFIAVRIRVAQPKLKRPCGVFILVEFCGRQNRAVRQEVDLGSHAHPNRYDCRAVTTHKVRRASISVWHILCMRIACKTLLMFCTCFILKH